MVKICFAASSGGHIEQISCLKELAQKYDSFLLTEMKAFSQYSFWKRQYYVRQINRNEKWFLWHFVKVSAATFQVFWKEKPDVIISTGSLAAFPMCLIGKIFGKKVVFIESFARVNAPSLTGRCVYPFADLFLVQWEEMKAVYPKAVYMGGLY